MSHASIDKTTHALKSDDDNGYKPISIATSIDAANENLCVHTDNLARPADKTTAKQSQTPRSLATKVMLPPTCKKTERDYIKLYVLDFYFDSELIAHRAA